MSLAQLWNAMMSSLVFTILIVALIAFIIGVALWENVDILLDTNYKKLADSSVLNDLQSLAQKHL